MVAWIGQSAVSACNELGHCTLVALDATQRVFNKFDPASDLLKLFLRASEVADGAFGCDAVRAMFPFIHAARDITGFVSARNIFGKVWGISSGNAGWEHPMGMQGPDREHDSPRMNVYTLGKNVSLAASDIGGTCKWLVTIGALSDIVSRFRVTVSVFGRSFGFNVLSNVCAIGGLAGCLFAIGEDIRQIVWGGARSADGRTLTSGLRPTIALDLVYRVSLIAGIVLTNYAGAGMLVFGLAALGVGCITSLAKFLYEEKNIGEIAPRRRPLPSYPNASGDESDGPDGPGGPKGTASRTEAVQQEALVHEEQSAEGTSKKTAQPIDTQPGEAMAVPTPAEAILVQQRGEGQPSDTVVKAVDSDKGPAQTAAAEESAIPPAEELKSPDALPTQPQGSEPGSLSLTSDAK